MAGNEIYGILDESKLKKASGAFPKEAEYKIPRSGCNRSRGKSNS